MSLFEGTLVATPHGQCKVEDLVPGTQLLDPQGSVHTVAWLRRRRYAEDEARERAAPICVRAGALGPGLPHQDLWLSADHGLLLDAYIVNANALINNRSVHLVGTLHLPAQFSLYDIETTRPAALVAHGVPIEASPHLRSIGPLETTDDFGARPRVASARLLPRHLARRFEIAYEPPAFTPLKPLLDALP